MAPVVGNPALKRILLLDSCQSGTMILALRGGGSEERAVDALNKTTGAYVISAANEEQGAGEAAEFKHGFFTFAFLEGLAGKADTNGNHIIEALELLPYVSSQVKAIAGKYGKEQQPLVSMNGGDFPVAAY